MQGRSIVARLLVAAWDGHEWDGHTHGMDKGNRANRA
jgi:hypothetical protein